MTKFLPLTPEWIYPSCYRVERLGILRGEGNLLSVCQSGRSDLDWQTDLLLCLDLSRQDTDMGLKTFSMRLG